MYAIIAEGGGQRRVTEGDIIEIDLLDAGETESGKSITFDRVLLVGGKVGADAKVGTPLLAGASVTAEIIEPLVKGPKLRIQYFQAKKGSRQKTGHRQKYTRVVITGINA